MSLPGGRGHLRCQRTHRSDPGTLAPGRGLCSHGWHYPPCQSQRKRRATRSYCWGTPTPLQPRGLYFGRDIRVWCVLMFCRLPPRKHRAACAGAWQKVRALHASPVPRVTCTCAFMFQCELFPPQLSCTPATGAALLSLSGCAHHMTRGTDGAHSEERQHTRPMHMCMPRSCGQPRQMQHAWTH